MNLSIYLGDSFARSWIQSHRIACVRKLGQRNPLRNTNWFYFLYDSFVAVLNKIEDGSGFMYKFFAFLSEEVLLLWKHARYS